MRLISLAMSDNKALVSSLCLTTFVLFLAQAVFFTAIFLALSLPVAFYLLFLAVCVIYHLLLLFLLLRAGGEFVLVPDEIPLKKVNLANILTLVRIASIPALFFLFLVIKTYPVTPFLIPFMIIVFLTDFFDGLAARKLKQVTRIGKYLDSISDYIVLAFSSILFFIYSLIPLWLFILIMARLVSQSAVVIIFYALRKRVLYFISTIGKASIFSIMAVFVFELLPLLGVPIPFIAQIEFGLQIALAAVIAVSLVDKYLCLKKELSLSSHP
jgi:phosphatidylglycerophosphate synthase